VWQVDWSVRGCGPALVLWHAARVRVLGPDPDLAGWLAGGTPVLGRPDPAFLAVAEVWSGR
jgi:hypothetical protein